VKVLHVPGTLILINSHSQKRT